MRKNPESDRNIDELSNDKIYAAIRYLEPDPESEGNPNDDIVTTKEHDDNSVVICVCLYVSVLGCLAVFWLYLR
jgi:hypothetical protein